MMKRYMWPFGSVSKLLAFALLGSLFALASVPAAWGAEIEWLRQFGSPNGDSAYAVDADDNVYVAGLASGALPGQPSAGTNDAFVRKYDAAGNELWTRQFGSSSSDDARGIAVDGASVYVVGYTVGILPGQTAPGGGDTFVRKYDAAGNELWTRQFGTTTSDIAGGVAVDASGVYVAGLTSGTLPGQRSVGGWDGFVRKYDADGNEVWTRQFGTNQLDEVRAASADATGIYVAGYTVGSFSSAPNAGGRDAFVIKYDMSGNVLWVRQFGGILSDEAVGVSATDDGFYVAMTTRGNVAPNVSVQKYDANGVQLWTSQFSAEARGVAADASGVYVAGLTSATLPGQSSAGGRDAFVRKYDAGGSAVWTRQFGTTWDDEANGVSAAPSGVYVVGKTVGTFPAQPPARSADGFVAKFGTP